MNIKAAQEAIEKFNEEVPGQERFKVYLILFLIGANMVVMVGNSLRLNDHARQVGHAPTVAIVADIDERLRVLEAKVAKLELLFEPDPVEQMVLQMQLEELTEEVREEKVPSYEERVKDKISRGDRRKKE